MDPESISRASSAGSFASQSSNYSQFLEPMDDTIASVNIDEIQAAITLTPVMATGDENKSPSYISRKRKATDAGSSTSLSKSQRTTLSASSRMNSISTAEMAVTSTSSSVVLPGPNPVIIAYSATVEEQVCALPWGVQWEIARLISAGQTYDTFTPAFLSDLKALEDNVKAAPEVVRRLQGIAAGVDKSHSVLYAKEYAATLPWEALDREQKYMARHPLGAIGCNEVLLAGEHDPEWWGGRVHFTAKLEGKGPSDFKYVLDRALLSTSNRVARVFGSHSILRVKLSREVFHNTGNALTEYIMRPLIVHGRVFRAFCVKGQSVLFFSTNERWNGKLIVKNSHSDGMSLLDFVRWHNPMDHNQDQTMVKWAARFVLALSNSVPGVRLDPQNINVIVDIVSPSFKGSQNVPSEQIMTDGSGFANAALFKLLQAKLRWENEPTAIQCRIAGAKGLLLLHPSHVENLKEEPIVWLRDSQIKIKYGAPDGKYLTAETRAEHLTVDVLRGSRMSSPARLSTETLINFADNGVPVSVFYDLMEKAMREKVEALSTWDGPHGLQRLWANVGRAGGVIAARLAREAAATARAKGFVYDDTDDEDDEDDDDKLEAALQEHSNAWWADPISGCPSSLEETVMVLLDGGFRPETCPVLLKKLHEVIKKEVNMYVTRYRIDTPMSCSAFIVPDPCGVLRSGQVHIKSAHRNLIDQEGRMTDLIVGDVVVTRHPCKVPSDAQKVTAVFHEKLRSYVNVIVVSTKDHYFDGKCLERHLASMTGGGDYDGDTMEAYWQPEIVNNFKNADPTFAFEPLEVQKCLVKNQETVHEFLMRAPPENEEVHIAEIQKYLLGPLKDTSLVGKYSTWWENRTYTHGYRDSDTIFLAYMFCAILDGTKTGVAVRSDKLQQHRRDFDCQKIPDWKKAVEDPKVKGKPFSDWNNLASLVRPREKGSFVMDDLYKFVHAVRNRLLAGVEERFHSDSFARVILNEHLAGPWREAEKRAKLLLESHGIELVTVELKKIRQHVEAVYDLWKQRIVQSKSKDKSFTSMPIVERQDRLRQISRAFHNGPDEVTTFSQHELARICASYAYIYDYNKSTSHWSRFPWDVAMRSLCEINAQALGLSRTVTEDFYALFQMSRAAIG